MPRATVEEVKYDLLPEDTLFTAELQAVNVRTIEYTVKKDQANGKAKGDRDSFDKWEWEFKIKGGQFDGQKVWGETDSRVTSHPENKPRSWGETLLGQAIDIGADFDTTDFVGMRCQLEVFHDSYEDKYGQTQTRAKVSQLYPLAGSGGGTTAGAPAGWSDEPPF